MQILGTESDLDLRVKILSVCNLVVILAHVGKLPRGIFGNVGNISVIVLARKQANKSIVLCASTQTTVPGIKVTENSRALGGASSTYDTDNLAIVLKEP